ncbi:MAG: RNA polymerase sigma factor [Deltaproteobacteria bacterium]|nr:RNA polymerase sigma factor [Deltaproteobacteria bacterium]
MTALEGKALLDHGEAIARRYAGRVGSEVADELRAEAVLRALRSPPPDGRMAPWLERIYRNLFVDLWRRRQPVNTGLDEALAPPAAGTPEEEVIRRERRRVVRESLGRLPRQARQALLARYYGDLDDVVTAARFGVAPATVRTRIHRALARLRDRLVGLRAWCPPLFARLATQAAAVSLAPVMVATLVVVGASSPEPEAAPGPTASSSLVEQQAQPPERRAVDPVVTDGPAPAPQPARPLKRSAPAGVSAVSEPLPTVATIAISDQQPVVREIIQPDGMYIFVEPERAVPPCMVEIPPDLLAQIDKMIEELH